MWTLKTTDLFGPDDVMRMDVADDELDDMKIFLRRHLRGVAMHYRVTHEGPNQITISVKATGNPVLYLVRQLN